MPAAPPKPTAAPFELPRSSGVLLHPTSLPGPHGVGDFGPEAYRWVQTLAAAKQSWWQILPLGPTGAGDSPYQSFSAFAGNVTLLSPDLLRDEGLLSTQFQPPPDLPRDHVDYARVIPYKQAMVRDAYAHFKGGRGPAGLKGEFAAYCDKEAGWLAGYALFMAIRGALGDAGLAMWPPDLLRREPVALGAMAKEVEGEADIHRFGQFLFDRQWGALRAFAAGLGVRILGDAPIFVAADSADVWAHPEEYLLDADRRPAAVAGVPPDYFSPTGQLWGNPLYDWERMAATGYDWWVRRIRRNLDQVDLVRLDHFRGFAAAWHVPVTEVTAINGKWVKGPGAPLFARLREAFGDPLPVVAEDLGVITPDVVELRDGFKLPGMRVLQFTSPDPANVHWPHNYTPDCVAYTGTHDNNTTLGWFRSLTGERQRVVSDYVGRELTNPPWDLLRLAWSSVAVVAVAPMQDVLMLGGEARMNTPGVPEGNWRWRFTGEEFRPWMLERLAEGTRVYGRVVEPLKAKASE